MTSSQQLDPKIAALGCGPGTGRSAGAQDEPSHWKQLRCQVIFGLLSYAAALGFVQTSYELHSRR